MYGHALNQGCSINWIRGKKVQILSHLRVFEPKKVSQLKVMLRDGYYELEFKKKLNSSNFEQSQSYMQMSSRVNTSFEDFLSHLKDPRVYSNDANWYNSKGLPQLQTISFI